MGKIDIYIPSTILQPLAPDHRTDAAKSPPSASRCSLSSSLASEAARHRDWSRHRRHRTTGRPPLGKPCARPVTCSSLRYPAGSELLHYLGNCRRKLCLENAFPAPTRNNLWKQRLPYMQAFIQLVSPISPPLLPLEKLVIGDAPAVVRRGGNRQGAATTLSWSRNGGRTGKKTDVSSVPARKPKSIYLVHRTRG